MRRRTGFIFLFTYITFLPALLHAQQINGEPFAHTFSIIAYDSATGDMGIAVQSHWYAVGTTVAWAEAGVGVIATQSVVNISFGPNGLALLKKGINPSAALDSLVTNDPGRDLRQVAILDASGLFANYTGKACVGEAGQKKGKYYSVQANTAESAAVWDAMGAAFERSTGTLGERMLAALEAAQSQGGDIRGKQSACLLIVRKKSTGKSWIDRKVDIRVDDNENPIQELKRIYRVHRAYDAMNTGFYALAKNDLAAADELFGMARELSPDNPEIQFWYAVELANKGAMDKALPVFKSIFQQDISWKNKMLPRIVKAGVLTVSEENLKKITAL